MASELHHETRGIGVRVAGPHESLRDIHALVRYRLSGAGIGHGLYCRYFWTWRNDLI